MEEKLNLLTQRIEEVENTNYESIAIAGCYNYQLGNHALAEKWLNNAFNQNKNKEVKNIAAAALGLIYLREREASKIKPSYISAAAQASLGRWMVILYYIDYYRETGRGEYLSFAIKALQAAHEKDGITPTSNHLLTHIQLIRTMDESCTINPDGDSCSVPDLNEQKNLLFVTAFGQLSFLLKKPPFQRNNSEQQSVELIETQ